MVSYDRMSALFWLGLGIGISAESIRLGPGSLSAPGPGLIPMGCGLLLGILGVALFISTFTRGAEEKEAVWEEGLKWWTLILALLSITGYALLIDVLGFGLTTLLWMAFICRLGKMGWKGTAVMSVFTTILCYVLFVYFLGIRFPRGIVGP